MLMDFAAIFVELKNLIQIFPFTVQLVLLIVVRIVIKLLHLERETTSKFNI
jgi:hypothetical protein